MIYSRLVLKISVVVGLFGFIMSRKQILEWIAPMRAVDALVLWYIAFGVFVTIIGWWVFSARWTPKYTIAVILVSWALGIVLYLPISDYSTDITGAQLTGVEAATEDMATYQALLALGIHDSTGIITYAIIPFLLLLLAGLVVAPSLFGSIFKSLVGRA